jgi:hypothetical protein
VTASMPAIDSTPKERQPAPAVHGLDSTSLRIVGTWSAKGRFVSMAT